MVLGRQMDEDIEKMEEKKIPYVKEEYDVAVVGADDAV